MQWWAAEAWAASPAYLVSWVVWVIVSITLHELGHGWMALRCGDDTPRASGHMTLNPLVHIPQMAWLMFAVVGFTWGLMPVQPANFYGKYDDAKVAFAGPAVNLILFALALVLDALWLTFATGLPEPFNRNMHMFLWTGTFLNLFGFIFNLVPIPPLDGSHILSNFSWRYREFWQREHGQMIGLFAFMALFFYGADYVWGITHRVSFFAIDAVLQVTGGQMRSPFPP